MFLENLYVNRELHAVIFEPLCRKFQISLTELLVLLFLKNNSIDTAKDIVHKLKLAKSHVSGSIHSLEEKGFIECHHHENNHKTIHLCILKKAEEVLHEGELLQNQFAEILVQDFTEEEKVQLKNYIFRMTENANHYLSVSHKK